jgi:phenylacetaldehyde dehydrogenase
MQPTVDAFLRRDHRLLIGGQWRAPRGDVALAVENPATGETLAQVGSANRADLDDAVAAARAALDGPWGSLNPSDRAAMLFRLADLVSEHADELAQIETLENGLPITLATGTIRGFCAEFIRYYAGWVTKIHGETLPAVPNGREMLNWLVYTRREPIGVVGAIIPWNAPASMIVLKVAPALAAGCTMILKPAELTPLLAIRFAELVVEAGIPAGVFNLVQGVGSDVGAAMASHPGIDKIAFTGSTAVGKAIVRAAADDLKRVSLELGGKSPFVVFPDANLEEAIPAAAFACFFLSGQNCMAGTRLFVHEAIHDAFVDGLVQTAAYFKVGNGMEADTIIGPLISARQKARVMDYMQAGRDGGAIVAMGGSGIDGPGHFVQPTIFTGCTPDMRIVQEEIFGPVLAVQRFDDDEAALLRSINSTAYGLSGSVWTRDLVRGHTMAARIDSGQVAINSHAAVSPETPFGGNRQSGWGREFGRDGLDAYLKTKAISVNLGPKS